MIENPLQINDIDLPDRVETDSIKKLSPELSKKIALDYYQQVLSAMDQGESFSIDSSFRETFQGADIRELFGVLVQLNLVEQITTSNGKPGFRLKPAN